MSAEGCEKNQTVRSLVALRENVLLYAVTRHTAAELISARANPADAHFGLLAWKGDQVRKTDILVAKNYLTEDEIDTLNRLVVIFLETAELRAKNRQETRMSFWKENIDQIVTSNGFPLLEGCGGISHERMEASTSALFLDFDARRKKQEALAADQADETELKSIEAKLRKRKP